MLLVAVEARFPSDISHHTQHPHPHSPHAHTHTPHTRPSVALGLLLLHLHVLPNSATNNATGQYRSLVTLLKINVLFVWVWSGCGTFVLLFLPLTALVICHCEVLFKNMQSCTMLYIMYVFVQSSST